MVAAVDLLSRGFLPGELPPPFVASSYAAAIAPAAAAIPAFGKSVSNPVVHNLRRAGGLRRNIHVPNPAHFGVLAKFISTNWALIRAHTSTSPHSFSSPTIKPASSRAVSRKYELGDLPAHRTRLRATARYLLVTDIARFYPSVYTHSIPWALHGKPVAKAHRGAAGPAGLGNQIDTFSRAIQDGQTVGIPIGPDPSLVIAEIVLTSVDRALNPALFSKGLRYIDDMEFGFPSLALAEEALSQLEGALSEYELALNPNKTRIDQSPALTEAKWVSELRAFNLPGFGRAQHYALLRYFDLAFEYAKSNPLDHVLHFALARASSVLIDPANWTIYQNLVNQSFLAEPGALRFMLDEFFWYSHSGRALDLVLLQDTLNQIIQRHAPRGHGSEVAWAVWAAVLLNVPLDAASASAAGSLDDPVVACLSLDALAKGRFPAGTVFPAWANQMNSNELYDSNWLLAYEASIKGWLPGVGGVDHVGADPFFSFLRANNVSFYDVAKSVAYVPTRIPLLYHFGGGADMSI